MTSMRWLGNIWVYGTGNFDVKGISKLKVDGGNGDPFIFQDVFEEFIENP